MYADHYEAVTARLKAHVGLVGKVFDVVRRNDAGEFIRSNYLVVTVGIPETGTPRQGRVQKPADDAVFDLKVRAVGTSPSVVMGLLDAVSAQWLGWVPQVAGRRCTSVRYPRQSVEIVYDQTANLFYADVEYTFRSHFTNAS